MVKYVLLLIILVIDNANCNGENNSNLWAWGRNFLGQLGNGRYVDTNYPVKVLIDDVKMVSAEDDHVMALKNDGTVWMWGKWKGYSPYNRPIKIPGIDNAIQISTKNLAAILKKDGTVWWWPDEDKEFMNL